MKADILAVGAELLLGEVVNSNAAWISQRLAELGVDVYFHATAGDNPARIQQALAHSLARSDAVILTGGLGPTPDDLTVSAAADYFGEPLIADADSERRIAEFFIARNLPRAPSNLKQALRPANALPILNPIGTAPGLRWGVTTGDGRRVLLLFFPGVPRELYAMWPAGAEALREFQRTLGETSASLTSRSLYFFGIGESLLSERIDDLMHGDAPSVAPYVGSCDVRVRLCARARDESAAQRLIAPVREEIVKRLAPYYYGEDDDTLESVVGRELRARGWQVSVAESCTGGLISSRLTDVAGSSAYVGLNVATYSNEAKTRLLDVPAETIDVFGAVSSQTAIAMAEGMRRLSGADVAVSITGIAGPDGGSEEKPVGLAWMAFCGLSDAPVARQVRVNSRYSRTDVKRWFSQYALFYLYQYIQGRLTQDV